MRDAIASGVLAATIALLPLFNRIAPVDFSRTAKDDLLMIIFMVVAMLMSETKRRMSISVMIIAGIAFFFTAFNHHNVISINVMFYSFYIGTGIMFLIRFYECFDTHFKSWIMNGMCIGALIQAVFIACSHFGIPLQLWMLKLFNDGLVEHGTSLHSFGQSIGTLGNPNLLGGYLALCLFAFLRPGWINLFPIALLAVISSGSMMAIGAALAGLLYYYRPKFLNKPVLFGLAVTFMSIIYFTGLNGMDSGRFAIWDKVLELTMKTGPIFGNGPGWFADQKVIQDHAWVVVQEHNIFLTVFTTFGLMGILAVLYLLVEYVSKKDNDRIFSATLFAAFCNGYGHFSLHQSTMVIIMLVTVAICSIKEG